MGTVAVIVVAAAASSAATLNCILEREREREEDKRDAILDRHTQLAANLMTMTPGGQFTCARDETIKRRMNSL